MSDLPDNQILASVAIRRGVDELRGLNARLETVEHHLEALLLNQENPLGSKVVGALQEIDLVVQSADALAEYFSVLAVRLPLQAAPISLSEALAPIRLRQLAERLAGKDYQDSLGGTTEMF